MIMIKGHGTLAIFRFISSEQVKQRKVQLNQTKNHFTLKVLSDLSQEAFATLYLTEIN